jgi:ribosomal protein S18
MHFESRKERKRIEYKRIECKIVSLSECKRIEYKRIECKIVSLSELKRIGNCI